MSEPVLITPELTQRPPRPANLAEENAILGQLAESLLGPADAAIQGVVEAAVKLCAAHSAGASLLEGASGEQYFRCVSAAGRYGATSLPLVPRARSVSHVTLESQTVQLFRHPSQAFNAFRALHPPIGEILLAPLILKGRALGTLWVVRHDEAAHFNAEDAR